MSFLVSAALAIGLLIALPLLAHRLRRGRTKLIEFPAALLVQATVASAERRGGTRDRALLAVRIALVAALALLGATPLVRCSRLSLDRNAGASVAMALVLDDSLSMRTETESGQSRWAMALAGARELLASAREGDAVTIVLAGRPARLQLAPTTDLRAARETLDALEVSDRVTALGDAVALGRGSLAKLPHTDRRVIVFSDLAGGPLPQGEPAAWTPLPALRAPRPDCGISSARRESRSVIVEIACTDEAAAAKRRVSIRRRSAPALTRAQTRSGPAAGSRAGDAGARAAREQDSDPEKLVASVALARRAGAQQLTLDVADTSGPLEAVLDGRDAMAHDDSAPVSTRSAELLVGIVADTASATIATGGPTLLEQGVSALARDAKAVPLPVVPDDDVALERFAALLIDDPPGLGPSARSALERFARRGGVAACFLGPRAASAQLASRLEPFLDGAAVWEQLDEELGMSAASLAWLGAEASSLDRIARSGRARLEGGDLPGSRVLGRWQDDAPWILERTLGRGLVYGVGLPVAVDASDWALRPAFLAFLSHLLDAAAERRGRARGPAGSAWGFPAGASVTVISPSGQELEPAAVSAPGEGPGPGGAVVAAASRPEQRRYTPVLRGAYVVTVDGTARERIVTLASEELSTPPRQDGEAADREGAPAATAAPRVDASRQIAWALLALLLAELALRAARRPDAATP